MEVSFVTQLEPTHSRWKSDQVHTTTQGKQMCKSVKSMCILTVSLSWANFEPKLTSTLTVTENKKSWHNSRCNSLRSAQQSLGTWRRHQTTRPWRTNPCGCPRRTSCCLDIHHCWNVLRDDKMDPPIHTGCFPV